MSSTALLFSSSVFLFLYLPAVLGLYFGVRAELRNGLLVVLSLLYYGWGEPKFLSIVLTSVALNYVFGLLVGAARHTAKAYLALATVVNVGLLGYYKYASFFVDNLNGLLSAFHAAKPIAFAPIALPLGISFFTFHALSYVIDISRGEAPAQKNPVLLTLYILFFPQLVAGPIVRYHEIASQLTDRKVSTYDFARGAERFVLGLGKKVLIANVVAEVADGIFALPNDQMTFSLAWLGAVAYTLQIYFDFSGYSDMAIGLARLFGFHFPENFNYPYVSRSITEFWRRWHISLSRWFRDYLYIPLGGNRVRPARLYVNLVTVFFLCGLWHGASWNFVIWGLIHGMFLVIERMGLQKLLARTWAPMAHLYCLLVVVVTWVFFRANTLANAEAVLKAMVGFGTGPGTAFRPMLFLDNERTLAIAAGCVGSIPWLPVWGRLRERLDAPWRTSSFELARIAGLGIVFVACALRLSAGTYNPFIYFRF